MLCANNTTISKVRRLQKFGSALPLGEQRGSKHGTMFQIAPVQRQNVYSVQAENCHCHIRNFLHKALTLSKPPKWVWCVLRIAPEALPTCARPIATHSPFFIRFHTVAPCFCFAQGQWSVCVPCPCVIPARSWKESEAPFSRQSPGRLGSVGADWEVARFGGHNLHKAGYHLQNAIPWDSGMQSFRSRNTLDESRPA